MKLNILYKNKLYLVLVFILTILTLVGIFLYINYTKYNKHIKLHENSIGYLGEPYLPFDFTIEKYKEDKIDALLSKCQNKKILAITFDDGPSKYTPHLLDILKKYDAHATFFTLAYKLDNNKDIVQRMLKENHTLATHGYSHEVFTKFTKQQLEEEISYSIEKTKEVSGIDVKYIRTPYGIKSDTILDTIHDFKLNFVLWHIDSRDWKLRNTKKIADRVIKMAEDKKIVLLHDTYEFSVNAVDLILDALKEEYIFVSLDELQIIEKYNN